jgi:3-isopropylmalate dehydrogenase
MYRIAVIGGDGIGPEVVREGLKVLEAVAPLENIKYELQPYDIGSQRYLKTGELLPDSVMAELGQMDAIYFGAIGSPDVKAGILERGILLKMRFEMDQYINLRPVKMYDARFCPIKDKKPEDVDMVFVRENTEGAYVGMGGFFKKGTPDEVAIQEDVNTRKGVERCIRYAFEYTKKRNKRNQLTLCDKSNVLTYGHDLWQRAFKEVGAEYSDIKQNHAFVDALAMFMIRNPEWYDVIVTNNMFGDILTDLGAIIQGGMGVAASGNINPEGVSMFEPVHGSAPQYAGKNVANPIAAVAAVSMMLDYLGEKKAAERIEKAIAAVVTRDQLKTLDLSEDPGTAGVGDLVAKFATE